MQDWRRADANFPRQRGVADMICYFSKTGMIWGSRLFLVLFPVKQILRIYSSREKSFICSYFLY